MVDVADLGDGKLPLIRVLLGFGFRHLLEVLWALCSGKRRSPAADARRVVSLIDPSPVVQGLHLVPRRDPFVLVANHYEAPNLWVGWAAAAITSAMAAARDPGCQEIHWLVHPEWRWFEVGGRWVPNPWTSLLFPRAIKVWGMIPTPARPGDVAGRARALRQIVAHLKPRAGSERTAPEPVGVFPEGTATFALQEAMPGSGAFLHRISRFGVPLLPVGVYHDGPVLTMRFGAPFFLEDVPLSGGQDLDGWARLQVMVAIGRLLPERLWGVYAEAIGRKG